MHWCSYPSPDLLFSLDNELMASICKKEHYGDKHRAAFESPVTPDILSYVYARLP